MKNKSIVSLIILLFLIGTATAQDPITLRIKYGAKIGEFYITGPVSTKDWDGNEFASFVDDIYVIENTGDIESHDGVKDDVKLQIVMKYEYKDKDNIWHPSSEPSSSYTIWSYLTLIGEDASKYKLEMSQSVIDEHDEIKPYIVDDTYTAGIRKIEEENARIKILEYEVTSPSVTTYTYGESQLGKDIKATINTDKPGAMTFVNLTLNQALPFGYMLEVGESLIQFWYKFLDEIHNINNPVETTITVERKTIDFTGDVVINSKPKDGTNDVIKEQITQLPELQGIIEGDDVKLTIDYGQTKYPSAAPGEYEIDVQLNLTGKDAGNYTLANSVVKTTAKITEFEKQKLELDGDFTILPKYFDNTDIVYKGEVVPPKFKNLIEGDKVEIVVDYTKTKFPESTIGTHLVRIYYSLGGDDAFKYTLSETSKMEYGEITGFDLAINTEPDANGVYQLTYTQSQLGEDLRITNPRNENETVKYLINGEDATKKMLTAGSYTVKAIMYQYETQVSECEWKVNVKKLKLKVSEPQIIRTKVYDGTTSVALTGNICQLVNSLETDDVAIASQTQEYDNPSIGSGKKITVSFVISGDLTDKYIAPDNIVFNDGVISPGKIEVSNITTIQTEYCQGDEIKVMLTITEGLPESAHITFDATAKANGFNDIDIDNLTVESETERSFILTVPENAAAGTYKGEITFTDPLGTVSQKYTLDISVMYQNSIIKSKFTDVVFIDNAEGKFVEYQWYKDGNKLNGETMQFYNDKNGINGYYSAEVKTTDGKTMKVCGLQLNNVNVSTTKSLAKKAEIYPNPAKASQPINIRLVNFTELDIEAANMYIFNSLGNKVLQRSNLTEEFSIVLPKGNYTVSILYNQQRISFKLIVND